MLVVSFVKKWEFKSRDELEKCNVGNLVACISKVVFFLELGQKI